MSRQRGLRSPEPGIDQVFRLSAPSMPAVAPDTAQTVYSADLTTLASHLEGALFFDEGMRRLYATDAS